MQRFLGVLVLVTLITLALPPAVVNASSVADPPQPHLYMRDLDPALVTHQDNYNGSSYVIAGNAAVNNPCYSSDLWVGGVVTARFHPTASYGSPWVRNMFRVSTNTGGFVDMYSQWFNDMYDHDFTIIYYEPDDIQGKTSYMATHDPNYALAIDGTSDFHTSNKYVQAGADFWAIGGDVSTVHNGVLCYGTGDQVLETTTATPNPAPQDIPCENMGIDRTLDIIKGGTLISGSIQAKEIKPADPQPDPNGQQNFPTDEIDFTYRYTLPGEAFTAWAFLQVDMGGNYGPNNVSPYENSMTALQFRATVSGPGQSMGPFSLWDTAIPGDPLDPLQAYNLVAMPKGGTIDIHVTTQYSNRYTDMREGSLNQLLQVQGLKLRAVFVDGCKFNKLKDNGMESYPNSQYWGLSDSSDFGRANNKDFVNNWFNQKWHWEAPACGNGWHEVSIPDHYGPIQQDFYWDGGPAYWKIRYKSSVGGWFTKYTFGKPDVYLTDSQGNIIQLYGNNNFDHSLDSDTWTMVQGTAGDLPTGMYTFHLDQAPGGDPILDYVIYDDLSIGHWTYDDQCDLLIDLRKYIDQHPELDTCTPGTPSASPTGETPTVSPTSQNTRTPSRTPGTTTATASRTNLPFTNTPRPTVTLGTITPSASAQPNQTGTSAVNGSATAAMGTVTAQVQTGTARAGTARAGTSIAGTIIAGSGTPIPGGTPGTGTPQPGPGEGTPAPGVDPPITGGVECIRPDGFNVLYIPWWIDYERCLTFAFVSWGPDQNATVQAIPTMFAYVPPIQAVGGIQHGISTLQAESAQYDWNYQGVSGVNDPVNPQAGYIFSSAGASNNPWMPGARLITGGHANLNYSIYCNSTLSGVLAGRLSEGLCFVLSIMRSIGYLGWVQFFLNLMCLVIIVRVILQSIQFYGSFQSAQPAGKGSEESQDNSKARLRR